jgi:hypothetical protein
MAQDAGRRPPGGHRPRGCSSAAARA